MKVYLITADYTKGWKDIYITSGETRKEAEDKINHLCAGAIYIDIKEINVDVPYYIDTHPN